MGVRLDVRILAGAMILAGCAGKPAPAPPPPPEPPPPVEIQTGVYRGTSTRFRADARGCPSPGLVTLTVQGRSFDYRWNNRISVLVTIAPDGSLSRDDGDANGDISVFGRATPDLIEGDISNAACALHFTARRRDRRG